MATLHAAQTLTAQNYKALACSVAREKYTASTIVVMANLLVQADESVNV